MSVYVSVCMSLCCYRLPIKGAGTATGSCSLPLRCAYDACDSEVKSEVLNSFVDFPVDTLVDSLVLSLVDSLEDFPVNFK